MNYDSMSVRDLVLELLESVRQAMVKWHGIDVNQVAEIESALRKAVIRESTLATVTIKTHEYEDEITAPEGSPDRIVTMSQSVGLDTFVPDGEYALVAKEAK